MRPGGDIDFFVFIRKVSLENLLFFRMPVLRFIVYSYFKVGGQTERGTGIGGRVPTHSMRVR